MRGDIQLVSRAADFALDVVDTITPVQWSLPTPCSRWNLQMLLRHICESVTAISEGLVTERVALFPHACSPAPADPAHLLRASLSTLIERWAETTRVRSVTIADHDIAVPVMAGVAALEFTIHGWDLARTIGDDRPIPPDLARDLLAVATSLLADGNRDSLFAPPIPVADSAGPGDELVAFLGRRPDFIRPLRHLVRRAGS